MHILLVDNYDSFTYNLYDYMLQLGVTCTVLRNDSFTPSELESWEIDALLLSPGPQRPEQAGCLMELIARYHTKLPMLGICLGHQALGAFFGAILEKAPIPVHGKTSWIQHNEHGLFKNLPQPMEVMRYHSLILNNLPLEIEETASTSDGLTMALRHRKLPLYGVQFHPESILSKEGLTLLENWVEMLKSIKYKV